MAVRSPLHRLAWRGALVGLACAFASWLLAQHGLARALEEWVQDGSFSYRGRRDSATADKIVLIALDELSLNDLKKPAVFVSPELAKVIRYLHEQQAAAIGLDLILHRSLDDAPDLNLQAEEVGKAADDAGNVVLAEALLDHPPLLPAKLWYLKSFRDEPRAPTDLGFVDLTVDDPYLRRQKLTLGRGDQAEYSFALALLAVSRQAKVSVDDGLFLDGERVPLDAAGKLRINFVGPPGSAFPLVSFRDALAAARGERSLGTEVSGAIVILGVTARSQQDYHVTPYANRTMGGLFRKEAALMAGPEVHANILATLADRAYLRPVDWLTSLPVLLLAGGLLGFLFVWLNLGWATLLAVVHLCGWWALSLSAFANGHWRVDVVGMLLLGLLTYATTCGWRWRGRRWLWRRAKFDVFLSYRRENGAETARTLKERLARDHVCAFLDVDDLPLGRFDEKLLRIISGTPQFLVILSVGSLDRCHDPDDWLRREVAHALQTGRTIVPVLMKDFEMPKEEELPEDVRRLTLCHGVRYNHELFRGFIKELLTLLKRSPSWRQAARLSAGQRTSGPLVATREAVPRRNAMYTMLVVLTLCQIPEKPKAVALVLKVQGTLKVHPSGGPEARLAAMRSLYPQDRITGDGRALLVFFSDCHRERLTKGAVTITAKGCEPADAVERLKPPEHKAVKVGLHELGPDSRIGAAVFRTDPGKPVTPFTGTTVVTDRPSFTWQPAAKVLSYQVRLLKAGSNVQVWKVETKEPKLAYPVTKKPLERGRIYLWRVSATTQEKDYEGYAEVMESKFSVSTAREAEELAQVKPLAESADLGDLLLAAVAYQAKGCYAETLAVYERLAERAPGEAGYHRALAFLYERAGQLDKAKAERLKGE